MCPRAFEAEDACGPHQATRESSSKQWVSPPPTLVGFQSLPQWGGCSEGITLCGPPFSNCPVPPFVQG